MYLTTEQQLVAYDMRSLLDPTNEEKIYADGVEDFIWDNDLPTYVRRDGKVYADDMEIANLGDMNMEYWCTLAKIGNCGYVVHGWNDAREKLCLCYIGYHPLREERMRSDITIHDNRVDRVKGSEYIYTPMRFIKVNQHRGLYFILCARTFQVVDLMCVNPFTSIQSVCTKAIHSDHTMALSSLYQLPTEGQYLIAGEGWLLKLSIIHT